MIYFIQTKMRVLLHSWRHLLFSPLQSSCHTAHIYLIHIGQSVLIASDRPLKNMWCIKVPEAAFTRGIFCRKLICTLATLTPVLDTIIVHAGSTLCKRLFQSHTLGKGTRLKPLNSYEGQCPTAESFVLTIHWRGIFLLNMEIHARGLSCTELTAAQGTEVSEWLTARQTKAVILGWIFKAGEILKAAFTSKHIMLPSLCAQQTSLQPPLNHGAMFALF